jgi:hypothetical protein
MTQRSAHLCFSEAPSADHLPVSLSEVISPFEINGYTSDNVSYVNYNLVFDPWKRIISARYTESRLLASMPKASGNAWLFTIAGHVFPRAVFAARAASC